MEKIAMAALAAARVNPIRPARGCALVLAIFLTDVAIPSAFGQSPTPPEPAAFTVSVVKPSGPGSGDGRSIRFLPGGRFVARNANLRLLIKIAYNLDDNQVAGGRAWIGLTRFDIDAKLDAPDYGDGTTESVRNRQRLQGLLRDRFHLQLRGELREMSTYALVVAKGGAKLKLSAKQDAPTQFRGRAGALTLLNATLDKFADAVSDWVGEPVLNMTGLTGEYDLTLNWTPDQPTAPSADTLPDTADAGPTIFTALQQQLGLSLQARKNRALCQVVENVQMPSPD